MGWLSVCHGVSDPVGKADTAVLVMRSMQLFVVGSLPQTSMGEWCDGRLPRVFNAPTQDPPDHDLDFRIPHILRNSYLLGQPEIARFEMAKSKIEVLVI